MYQARIDLKSQDSAVKEEPVDVDSSYTYNSSENPVMKSLYEGHVVKEEMVIGPEIIQDHVNEELRVGALVNHSHHEVNKTMGLKEYVSVNIKQENETEIVQSADGHLQLNSNEDKGFSSQFISKNVKTNKYYCRTCKEKFIEKSELKNHRQKHRNEKPFTCDHCLKTFVSKNNLKNHILNHNGERCFKCTICNKAFASSNYLINHRRSHTHKRPRNFKCSLCDKAFHYQSLLLGHENAHKGIKPYSCDLCEKRFYAEIYLVAHKKVHERYGMRIITSERPFACTLCPNRFRTGYHLRRHSTNVHGQIVDTRNSEDQELTRDAPTNCC